VTEVTAVQCSVLLPDYVSSQNVPHNRIIWAPGDLLFLSVLGLLWLYGLCDWGGYAMTWGFVALMNYDIHNITSPLMTHPGLNLYMLTKL
jgi:hypothetical protein